MRELVPRLIALAQQAKGYDLNFTVDAEEADRLELSLDVIDAVIAALARFTPESVAAATGVVVRHAIGRYLKSALYTGPSDVSGSTH